VVAIDFDPAGWRYGAEIMDRTGDGAEAFDLYDLV
jgi:hypothetical protein